MATTRDSAQQPVSIIILEEGRRGGKHMEKEQLEEYLGYRLQEEEKKWGITEPVRGTNNLLIELIDTAYEKTG